ncbi:MAG: DUF5916 domain-containing protein [Reichenbachiella sp.]|uniref:carbohydrate binding family 9 domain-containing protein n=3 Tax=Reichenbachiella sp. TaxID=2184521 RepID=UPI003264A492
MNYRLTAVLVIMATGLCFGNGNRANNNEGSQLAIVKTKAEVNLDGILDEELWAKASESSEFINKWPQDTGLALAQTKVKLAYNEEFLYVAAICYQDMDDLVIQSLKRDNTGAFWDSDGFTIGLDPINTKSNGYLFGVNAGGAQMEATLTARQGNTNMDSNWDNKWFSAVRKYEDHWIVEMAIPFKTLRYNQNNRTWGMNLIRNDMKRNVYSTWAHVPIAFDGIELGYFGTLEWDAPPAKSKGNRALIPYISTARSKDHEEGEPVESNLDVGMDAKIALTSSLSLDLTVNPDFSNVDVDQQVTNVSRFSVFFPEKRGFFLENSDLFSNFGTWGVRPFFSRRIGIDDGDQVPIAFGARISGNLTDDLRIGIMDVHTRATSELNPTNFFVGSVQHRIFKRSSVKALFTNKEDYPEENSNTKSFNRTGGAEFNYTSATGKLNGSLRTHWATTEEGLGDNQFLSLNGNYRGPNVRAGFNYNMLGENYIAEMGFTPRLHHYDAELDTTIRIGYHSINPWIGYVWNGNDQTSYRNRELFTWSVFEYDMDGNLLGRRTSLNGGMIFRNNSRFYFNIRNSTIQLQVPADLIDDDTPLPVGRYDATFFELNYSTNPLKKIFSSTEFNFGQFFNGSRIEFSEEFSLRAQPWGVFSISYRMNKITLAEGYGETILHLLGPKAEISLRNNMWWTTFVQFNTQDENFNINSRLQWRYKPMSDFFLVYSDNYATTDFKTKNRGLVFKLTYWLNI